MMLPLMLVRNAVLTMVLALSVAAPLPAQDAAQTDFQRGYYLQMHQQDLAGAAIAYEAVLDNNQAAAPLRSEAKLRLSECREDLAAADFSRLMPPDVIAYAEISNPGGHLSKLVEQMGLFRKDAPAAGTASAGATPLARGVFLPNDFTLSPALIDAMQAFRGVAVAITRIDPNTGPEGVLVLHPGEAKLLRGTLESAIQFCEPADAIEGYRAYRIQGQAWACMTSRLLLVSRSRDQLVEAVRRLHNPKDADSLANSKNFQANRADREGALFYAYVDGPKAAAECRQYLQGREIQIATGFLDLDHLKSVSIAGRATDEGLAFQFRLDLMEGHHNLAYGLIRTAPCNRSSLEFVPAGAAGVALLGLNPPTTSSARSSSSSDPADAVSAMDIGREFFANIEEVALYVSPLASTSENPAGPPIPDVGLVFIAKDPAKSQALWSQLLSLPAMFMPQMGAEATETTVENVKAKEYHFPQAPPVLLARVQDRAVVIGTRGAVAASIRTGANHESITNDAGFKSLLSRLTPSTSKAVLIHVGRATETAATLAPRQEAERFKLAASILANLRICVVTEEKPTQFAVRVEATGLPNVPDAVRKLAAMMNQQHGPGQQEPKVSTITPPGEPAPQGTVATQ